MFLLSIYPLPWLLYWRRLLKDRVMLIVDIGMISGLLIILYTPLAHSLKLVAPNIEQLLLALGLAAAAVFWYEIIKALRRHKGR
jgi:Ca2+-transporting ATPase